MNNVLLTLSYDGTDFCGWQRQDKADNGKPVRTVQGTVEDALEKMLKQKIALCGSGRTDSGVHARAQAANFFSPFSSIKEENFVRALNGFLPRDVRVMGAKFVADSFSARFSATSRVYRYFIKTGGVPFARDSRYVWHINRKPNLGVLNDLSSILHGELDFKTFTSSGDQSVSTNRYIEKAHFWYEDEILVFEIEANAFLWKMVRSLTGTLLSLEGANKTKLDFENILKSKNRSNAGTTAPPTGLFLWEVKFDGTRRHV